MLSRLLRGLAFVAYALVLVLVFGLAAYTSFSLFVRSGVTAVPPLKGLTREEAANRLADQGLDLRRVEEEGRYDDKVPKDRIVRQNPDPRTLVKRGSDVTIILSKGPQRVEVPNVEDGKPLAEAQRSLSTAGLALGQIHGIFVRGRDRDQGTILEQDPDPGAEVPPASPVNLLAVMTVLRDRYIMPDLVYRDYETVRPFFERRGFHFGSVRFERYEGVAAGVVLRQYPLPGHPVSREEAISLVVATADNLPEGPLPPPPPAPAPPPPATPVPPAGAVP